MEKFPEQVTRYKCPICEKEYRSERDADHCGYENLKERCINHDFKAGFTLEQIFDMYGLYTGRMTDEQKRITKDNCFVFSHLQCCDRPAYQIVHIGASGRITVGGKGSWSGYYGCEVSLDSLKNPRPKEELYVDPR